MNYTEVEMNEFIKDRGLDTENILIEKNLRKELSKTIEFSSYLFARRTRELAKQILKVLGVRQ
jgi:hypothetical protein